MTVIVNTIMRVIASIMFLIDDDDDDDDDDKSYINNKCKNGHSNKNQKSLKTGVPAYSFITR